MNEVFLTVAQKFLLFLSYQKKKKLQDACCLLPTPILGLSFLWNSTFLSPFFGTTIVYILALLSHNLWQYLRDAGGSNSTLETLRKCSIRTISTHSCPKSSQCDTSAQRCIECVDG